MIHIFYYTGSRNTFHGLVGFKVQEEQGAVAEWLRKIGLQRNGVSFLEEEPLGLNLWIKGGCLCKDLGMYKKQYHGTYPYSDSNHEACTGPRESTCFTGEAGKLGGPMPWARSSKEEPGVSGKGMPLGGLDYLW